VRNEYYYWEREVPAQGTTVYEEEYSPEHIGVLDAEGRPLMRTRIRTRVGFDLRGKRNAKGA
jgi:hypothetical protein